MTNLNVYRVLDSRPILVGELDRDGAFTYATAYVNDSESLPLSISLPLGERAFPPLYARPYFDGLLAEGAARTALCGSLRLREDDYLGLLAACAHDCIGDVMVRVPGDVPEKDGRYESLSQDELRAVFLTGDAIARESAATRLSLAGTQDKTALAHDPREPVEAGWLKPMGLAATTHILKVSSIRDIPEVEYLCMKAAAACGIDVPEVGLLDLGRPVLVEKRFDRHTDVVDGALVVRRLHQEDCCQAFGVSSASKYAELPGGSIGSIAKLLRRVGRRPSRDLTQLAKQFCYIYVIGDCDAHLKNYSLLHKADKRGDDAVALCPAYDLVSTTYFPKFSRELAMDFGDVREIDDVDAGAFEDLSNAMGLRPKYLASLARDIVENVERAILECADTSPFESTSYVADDLIEDIRPRLEVLAEFCRR